EAQGSRHAPGVRRSDQRPGLHARAALLRGAMAAGPDSRLPGPLTPGQGPGWAKLAEAVAARVPPAEIDTIYLFRPLKRGGREWGTAVVTRRPTEPGGRVRVHSARDMLMRRGMGRGPSKA